MIHKLVHLVFKIFITKLRQDHGKMWHRFSSISDFRKSPRLKSLVVLILYMRTFIHINFLCVIVLNSSLGSAPWLCYLLVMSRQIQKYLSSYYVDLCISEEINCREKIKANKRAWMGDRRKFCVVNGTRERGSQW